MNENYWLIMESLNFPVVGVGKDDTFGEEERIKHNLTILKDFMKVSPEDAVMTIMMDENVATIHKIVENSDDYFLYSLYSLKMLLDILKNAKLSSGFKDDLIAEKHKSLLISAIMDVAKFGIEENLHVSCRTKQTVFMKRSGSEPNLYRLKFLVDSFYPLMFLRELRVGKSLDDVQLCYMASIYSLFVANDTNDSHLDQSDARNLQDKLQYLWVENSKKLYFRNLMLLYACLPKTHVKRIHKEMLLRLWSSGGFVALLFSMAESQHNEEMPLDETVSNLVAQPNFSIKAQQSLIQQILEYLETSINKDFSAYLGAALLSLKKFYDIREENRKYIQNWILEKFEPLIKVDISAMIAMEWSNFSDLISLLFQIFCTSSIGTIPTDSLVPYLPLLLDIYKQIDCHINQNTVTNHLHSIILKILNNRSKEELKQIIESVTLKCYPNEWFQLSSNIQIIENPLNMQELKLSTVKNASDIKLPLASLVAILKKSSYNLLTYQHFLIILQLLPSVIMNTNSAKASDVNIDLLTTEEDIYNKILADFSHIYENKVQILKALEALVQHQPLKTLINENIKELLKVLQDILIAYTKILCNDSTQAESNSEVLMILIILIRDILENCSTNAEELQTNLHKPLKMLESKIHNKNGKYQINCLLKIITGEESCSSQHDISRSDFEDARSLIESHESYLQVQGIEMMIKLLHKRDAFTVTNGHVLTALALNTLKSHESYTFLNCVRLFVALVYVNESEVLNLLSEEYLNEAAAMDYRLVIGEAILKVSKELGPLCYRYKNILLNTYMTGCRSPLDEFRFSAFANLSQMCRQLTYQVHNYFQELLNLIDCELTSGKYLPAKRAAVMVLSDLLAGMDNLFDYEEMLLPIYRLLKYLVASERSDEKIRIHASNGLMYLSEKCTELMKTGLEQAQQCPILQKEIKIMGIHEKSRTRQVL